eukprot:4118878-Amphidinium_carterae.1
MIILHTFGPTNPHVSFLNTLEGEARLDDLQSPFQCLGKLTLPTASGLKWQEPSSVENSRK